MSELRTHRVIIKGTASEAAHAAAARGIDLRDVQQHEKYLETFAFTPGPIDKLIGWFTEPRLVEGRERELKAGDLLWYSQ